MHFSQSHGYNANGSGSFVQLGTFGYSPALLRNSVNDLCLSCHDGNVTAPDVLGTINSGSEPGIVRTAGYLSRYGSGGANHVGHVLDSLDFAPGSQPSWNSEVENGPGRGLDCVNCHDPHGAPGSGNPFGNQYRNLRSNPGYVKAAYVTYNDQTPGTNDLTRDVFQRSPKSFDESAMDWNEPDPQNSAIARWCMGCHTNMHGNANGQQSGPWQGTLGGPFIDHPVAGENADPNMLTRYNLLKNKVKVMSQIGVWNPAGSDVTPTCVTCHRGHGNGNPFGLIFRSGTGTPSEDGDSNGHTQADLCAQCHTTTSPFSH
jgi:hypothetical protein